MDNLSRSNDTEASLSTAVEPEPEKHHGDLESGTAPPSLPSDSNDNKVNPADASQPPQKPGPPGGQPDGGFWAWVQVAACFSIFLNTWGMLNTFGIFQTYYESGALFQESSSNIAWIGSIQAYCMLVLGLVAGPVYDKGHLRLLMVSGSFFIVFGFMMLSICKTFWQVLLTQGFCVGIGGGLLFTPSLALLPTYFSTKLGLVVGLASSGSSLGGVIYPIVFYKLIDQIGFGWTVRAIAFIILATLLVPMFFAKMRVKPAHSRAVFDPTAFRDAPYLVFVVTAMLGFIGLFTFLFYLSYFAAASGSTTEEMAFYLVPILNAGSIMGRTIPNAISDKTGPLNIFWSAAIVCGALCFAMLGTQTLASLIVLAILYGFFSGVFIALPGVCFVHLTADKSKIGTRIGMGFAFIAFGVLAGGPGGGNLLGTNRMDLHWDRLWILGGCMSMGCGVLLLALRMWLAKGKIFVKI